MTDMRMSQAGVDFLKALEAYKEAAYNDGYGNWTVGWGHTKNVSSDTVYTPDQAEAALQEDIAAAEGKVNGTISVPLTQNQFDAMVSVAFNGGYHTGGLFNQSINNRDALGIAQGFLDSATVNHELQAGLVGRRMAEAEIFFEGIYDPSARDQYSKSFKNNKDETIINYFTTTVSPNYYSAFQQCFSGSTPILIGDNEYKKISDIEIGDIVYAFDASTDLGRGPLVPKRVTRLYRNSTTEWVRLRVRVGNEFHELVTTPGHHFLDKSGFFPTISQLLENPHSRVVLASGDLAEVFAERIVYTSENAASFERVQSFGIVSGNAVLKAVDIECWQTYNFEVEDLHTYVAGGVRVHNDSGVLGEIANQNAQDSFGLFAALEGPVVGLAVEAAIGQPMHDLGTALDALTGYNGGAPTPAETLNGIGEVAFGGIAGVIGGLEGAAVSLAGGLAEAVNDAEHGNIAGAIGDVAGGVLGGAAAIGIGIVNGLEATALGIGDIFSGLESLFDGDTETDGNSYSGWSSQAPSSGGGSTDSGGYYGGGGSPGGVGGEPGGGSPSGGDPTGGDGEPDGGSPSGGDPTGGGGEPGGGSPSGDDPTGGDGEPGGGSPSGGDGGDSGGSGGGSGGGDGGGGSPVILDLTGKGINITPRGASDVYFDMAGDGKQHQTAWAGAGNGVLVLDLDGSGKITQADQIQFTAWDPTASSDMDALKDVFDTNHNGKLDSGDANWANFKVMVTNADGSTTLQTLSALGITSINLISNHQSVVLPDGSGIKGETTFTRSNGTTGTAADAVLAYDTDGYVVKQTLTHNSDGTTTIDSKSSDVNGNLAKEVISTYSANGNSISRKFDDNGDGVFGRTQTETIVTNSDGSITETIRNYNYNGSNLTSVVQTTTASNGKLKTVAQDTLGAGHFDEMETISIGSDSSQTTTVSDLNPDGTAHDKVVTTASADGLTKTVVAQQTGNGQTNSTQSDLITVATNGTRTETVTNYAGSGTATANIVSQTTTVSSSDGSSKTAKSDLDGNGSIDLTTTSSIVFNSDHSTTTTQTDTNGDASLRDRVVTTLSASGLVTTTKTDADGDGTFETVTTETLVHNSDGSGSDTKITNNANGTERFETLSSWSADGKTRTSEVDADGDGHFDRVDSTVVGTDGSLTETTSSYTLNGATLISKQVAKTSADAKTKTVQTDLNADGTFDSEQQITKVSNSDGSSTVTQIFSNGDGSVPTKKIVTTASANGLSTTIQTFLDGATSPYEVSTDVKTVNSDGSTTRTVTFLQGTAQTQVGKTVTKTSADKSTTTVSNYIDTNTNPASVTTTVLHTDGSTTQTVSNYSPDGSKLLSTNSTTTSADGLNASSTVDKNGDGVVDATSVSHTVLGSDGTTQVTVTNYGGSGTAAANEVSQTVTTTSANGLSVTTQTDGVGTGTFTSKSTDVTVLNSNGSKTETRSLYNGSGTTLLDRTTITTSATGLTTTTTTDANGDGVNDSVITDTIVLNADGSTTETRTVADAAGDIIQKTVATRNNSKGTATVSTYLDASAKAHETKTTTVNTDGSVTTTDTTYDTNGNVTSTFTSTTSANGLSQSTSFTDSVGVLGSKSTSSVTALNVDGSRTQTFSESDGTGKLLDKSVKTTSADGLSSTVKWDDNGDGVFDYSMSSATTINADGSSTSVTSSFNADNSLHNRTTVTTSADGNTVKTTRDLNGDGVVDQTIQSSLNSDGSTTVSLMDGTVQSASGRAYGATDGKYQTVSADGLTTTIFYDGNGDGLAEKERITTTVLGTDGSRTTTVTNEALSGGVASSATPAYTATVTDRTLDQISANGLSETTKWDTTGSGVYAASRSNTTVLNSDGSATQTVGYYNNGILTSQKVTTTAGNGLSTTTTWDPTGSGQTIQQTTSLKTLNSDGSSVVAINNFSLNGHSLSDTTTTTSADGLSTKIDVDENGPADIHKDRWKTVQTLADGSVLTNLSDTDGHGYIDIFWTEVSADGRRTESQIDADGDGNTDQGTETIVAVDGSSHTTVTNYNPDGSTASQIVSSTTADGLTTTTQQDLNGNGVFDRKIVDVTTSNADGSTILNEKTYSISQVNSSGSESAITPVLMRSLTRTTSADGRTITTTTDVDGNGSIDKTEATVVRADGSQTTTTTENAAAEKYQSRLGNVFWQSPVAAVGQLFAAKSVTTVRSDGMSWTVQSDYDGNGTNEHTENWTKNIDGSEVAAISDVNSSGAVIARGIETVSADGLYTILDEDTTNSGRINHIVEATTRVDGSEVEITVNINSNGSLANATTTIVSADGQTSSSAATFAAGVTKTITQSNGQQDFEGTTDTVSVSGNSETVTLGGAVNKVTLTGTSDTVHTMGNSLVTIAANGSNETLDVSNRHNIASVSNAIITGENDSALTLSGNNNIATIYDDTSFTLWSGTGDLLDVEGNGDEVHGSSLNVGVGDNHDVLLQGNNDSVVAYLNTRVVDTDTGTTGNSLEVNESGVNATVNGWNVVMDDNTSLTLMGNGNAIAVHNSTQLTVASGTGDALDIFGTNVTANVSNATATIENGATVTLTGNNLTVTEQTNGTVSVTGTGDTITVIGNGGSKATASGATITLSGSGTDTLTGNQDTVNMGKNTSLQISGANDNLVFHSGFGTEAVSGYQASGATADKIAFDHTSFSGWSDLLSNSHQSGSDVIIATHTNDTLTLKNTSLSNLQQSNFSFA